MPVQWTKVEMPFGGIDQKTAAAHVLPGSVVNAENVRRDKVGNLRKRRGFSSLGNANVATPRRLTTHRDEVLVCDDVELLSYSFAQDEWVGLGRCPKFHAERTPVARPNETASGSGYTVRDVAASGSVFVIAMTYTVPGASNESVRVLVVEQNTGAIVDDVTLDENVNSASIVRCVAVSTVVFVLYGRQSSTDIGFIQYSATDGDIARSAEASLSTTNAMSPSVWDAAPIVGASDRWVIAGKALSSADIEVEVFDTAATPASQRETTLTPASGTPELAFAVYARASQDVYIAWDDGTAMRVWSCTETGLASNFTDKVVASPFRPDRIGIVQPLVGTSTAVIVTDGDVAGTRSLLYGTVTDAGTFTGAAAAMDHLYLASQPWENDNRTYVLAYYDSSAEASDPTYYIYEIADDSLALLEASNSTGPILLGTLARTLGALSTAKNVIPKVTEYATDLYVTGVSVSVAVRAIDADSFVTDKIGTDLLVVDARGGFTEDTRFLSAPWGPSRFFAGAQPMLYDGWKLLDTGHTMRPDLQSGTAHAGGSTYKYRVVWEWTNAAGQIERSAPSAVLELTSATTSMSHTVVIPDIIPGNRFVAASDVRAGLYRTEADGDLYYLVKYVTPDVSTVDTLSDSDLTLNEPLYTDGGVLPNIGPPACTHVVEHRERLFAVGLDGDPEGIAFTKPYRLGTAPEWVADAFVIRIPGAHKLTAVATLDTALVVFSRSDTWLVFGDGPPDTGANLGAGVGGIAGFQVQHVTGDVGCDNPRSIVRTPQGIMFQSGKGIYLLDRSYSMHKSGAVVERILDTYDTVTGAALIPNETEVHFSAAGSGAAEDGGGRILVYDYFLDQWSVDNLSIGLWLTSIAAYQGPAVSTPEVFIADINGLIYKTDHAAYADAGSFYAMSVEFGPLAINTLKGWQRTRKVVLGGVYSGDHGLQFDFAYDNDADVVSAWDDTVSRTDAQMLASGYPVEIRLPRQKAATLRMRVTETVAEGSGETVWSTVVFEVGMKAGVQKLPINARG